MFDLEAYIAAEHAEYDRRLKIHEEIENTLSQLEKEREAIEGRLSQSEDEKERLTQLTSSNPAKAGGFLRSKQS